jgi:hypothetical protein
MPSPFNPPASGIWRQERRRFRLGARESSNALVRQYFRRQRSEIARKAALVARLRRSTFAPAPACYFSAVMVTTSCRSRGPSSSISTTLCQVPSRIRPRSKGSATEVPISADRM